VPTRAWPNESRAFAAAFAAGKLDPIQVVERALRELSRLREGRELNVLESWLPEVSRREAEASARRWKEGIPHGPFDGVPFLVKDEFDVAGLPTTLGALAEPRDIKRSDATPVSRLRESGAVLLGKTVLTEWGMSPLGQNPHTVMPHNAHHRGRLPGGSSTGSAVGVALGLSPVALGGDGGGSIRIPSCLNGVFGIKPTFGRVSRAGDGFKGTVAHAGPIAVSTTDLALALDVVAGAHDPDDPETAWAPAPPEGGFGARLGAGVKGLRIGVPSGEWEDASAAVERAGREALRALEREGAVLVPLLLPLAKNAAPIGYFTIGCESFAACADAWKNRREEIGDDVRLSYAVIAGISAGEYLDAQRLRSALRLELAEALRHVDVIALPTTATAAAALPDADRHKTFSDPTALDAMCRFAFLGNLTGLPAATAPVGTDPEGLPVGLQIVGDAWCEDVVLGVLAHLERLGVAHPVRPKLAVDLLSG
jgi:aspartyl-tRNA(Asn)/glutamyl-tRNA(Gln) amidotransferase subunit A